MSIKQGGNTIAGLQDISGKADTDLSNVLSNIDFVIETQLPTATNNYTWYRKYKSGWVEQGGHYTGVVNAGSSVNITLPITMADTNYTCSITGEQNSNNWSSASLKDGSRTTTGFDVFAVGGSSSDKINGASWQVSGMSAS